MARYVRDFLRNRPDVSKPELSLLCLKCRGIGHLAERCNDPTDWSANSFAWFFSESRKEFFRKLPRATETCRRCESLKLVQLLRAEIPWRNPSDLIQAQLGGHSLIRKLGQAGNVVFSALCPVCVCLFAMTPSPASAADDIFLFPDWTMNRLAGENGTEMDREEKRKYAKCLLVALEPNFTNTSFYVRSHRGDAMCIVEEDLQPGETLGARMIKLDQFNFEQYKTWIKSCQDHHGQDCDPEFTDELHGIRLVDVSTREIVAYPGSPCEYAALSYVWGGIEQRSYQLGSKLGPLPRTVEDAMICTNQLGKRYLWVDSLCIDQNDERDKVDQIARMWSIYRGSSITLISLSSSTADSGLPRFNTNLRPQPQLACSIDGVRLAGLMPTLSQYIWVESWGSRAWTLQEALLSHRCLYLSDHQLYFECETMQYCESLDESRSWAHSLKSDNSPDRTHWLTWIMEQNGSGCLRNLLDTPADRFLHWGQKITLYSYRAMTKQEDGLRAFSGVLQRLQTMYTAGFFWGLPLEDFQWALLWQAQWPPQHRRPGFPSWCWAAWQVGLMTPFPSDIKLPHRYSVPLRVWKATGNTLELLFDAEASAVAALKRPNNEAASEPPTVGDETMNTDRRLPENEGSPSRHTCHIGPHNMSYAVLDDTGELSTEEGSVPTQARETYIDLERKFNLAMFEDAEEYGALFMEALTVQLQPDWSTPTHERAIGGLRGVFIMDIGGVRCGIYMMTSDTFIGRETDDARPPKYLLLAFDTSGTLDCLYILVVNDLGQFCTRATSLSLLVRKEDCLKLLEILGLRKEYIVLA